MSLFGRFYGNGFDSRAAYVDEWKRPELSRKVQMILLSINGNWRRIYLCKKDKWTRYLLMIWKSTDANTECK